MTICHSLTPMRLLPALLAATLLSGCNSDQNSDYAAERALVDNLYARYAFAADWQDADTYASLFTTEGVLDWAGGVVEGREAIRQEVKNMRGNFASLEAEDAPLRPARLRHFITNLALDIEGDTATGRAFWVEFDNRNPERQAYSGAYGHSEDELRKVNGEWLFARRVIFNEEMDERAAPASNPAW